MSIRTWSSLKMRRVSADLHQPSFVIVALCPTKMKEMIYEPEFALKETMQGTIDYIAIASKYTHILSLIHI